LLARSWVYMVEVVSKLFLSHMYSLLSSASPPLLGNLPWVSLNSFTASTMYTQERANKLVLAFGDRWQSECFKNPYTPGKLPTVHQASPDPGTSRLPSRLSPPAPSPVTIFNLGTFLVHSRALAFLRAQTATRWPSRMAIKPSITSISRS